MVACHIPLHLPPKLIRFRKIASSACILLFSLQIRIIKFSSQSAKVSWSLPQDIECNGELMGFTMELNSTYETNQHITITPDVTEYTLTGTLPYCTSNWSRLFNLHKKPHHLDFVNVKWRPAIVKSSPSFSRFTFSFPLLEYASDDQ